MNTDRGIELAATRDRTQWDDAFRKIMSMTDAEIEPFITPDDAQFGVVARHWVKLIGVYPGARFRAYKPFGPQGYFLTIPEVRMVDPEKWVSPFACLGVIIPPGYPQAAPGHFYVKPTLWFRDGKKITHSAHTVLRSEDTQSIDGWVQFRMHRDWHANTCDLLTIVNGMRVTLDTIAEDFQ